MIKCLFGTAVAVLMVSLPGQSARAQPSPPLPPTAEPQIIGLFGISIPSIPGLPTSGGAVGEILKGAAAEQVIKALGTTLTEEAPIQSSSSATFPTINILPGAAFQPQSPNLIAKIRPDGSVALAPGDYRIPVDVFCMKASAHSPAGHRYRLAPLKGKWADIVAALNARSASTTIPHSQLQVLSWNLQAGMKYEELTPELRSVVDQVIPEFKPRLSRSFYEQIEAAWGQVSSTVPGLPSLDGALGKLGDVGKTIVLLRQTRSTLMQYGNNFEALSRSLVLTGGQQAIPGGAANTPWSQVSPQVYARLITDGNYASPAEFQIRVTATPILSSRSAATKPCKTPNLVQVPITSLVGDPGNSAVQPLSISPRPPKDNDEDESGSGSLQIQERGYSGPQTAPLNQV
jgi:hypothetical protein